MKRVVAVVRSYKVDEVTIALGSIGIKRVTISEATGGGQRQHTYNYRGVEYINSFSPKTRIEVAVADDDVPRVVDLIASAARTGKTGDGKIMVSPMDDIIRIRTGEHGHAAL